MINKYKRFVLDKLFESILITSKDFVDIIKSMPPEDKISDILSVIIDDKEDIKTNYNDISDVNDKNDEISFIPDTQYQRFLSQNIDTSTKTKSMSKIGRVIRQILNDNPGLTGIKFTDSDIEKFVNSFKNSWNKKHGVVNRKTEIVTGDKIKFWYDVKNYETTNGILGNSCMRYKECQDYFKIYTENPDKVSMVIVTEDDKLVARALIWKMDDGSTYLDRIYTTNDSDIDFVKDWVEDNIGKDNLKYYIKNDDENNFKCSLSKVNFDKYPYLDTLYNLYVKLDDSDTGYITNDVIVYKEGYMTLKLRETDGTYENRYHIYSNYLKKWITKGNCTYVSKYSSYIPDDMLVMCKFLNTYYISDDTVFSKSMQDYIPKEDSINTEKFGIVLKQAITKACTKYIGKYTDPFEILYDIEENPDVLQHDEVIINKRKYFKPDFNPSVSITWYSKDMMVEDLNGEKDLKILCYEVYKVVNDNLINIPGYTIFGLKFITKEYAELFDIEIEPDVKYVLYNDYANKIKSYLNYHNLVDTINYIKGKYDLKLKVFKSLDILHNYLLEYSTNYKIRNSNKGLDYKKVLYDLFENVYISFSKKVDINKSLTEYGISYYGTDTNLDLYLYNKAIEVYLYYYLSTRSSYDAKGNLDDYLYKCGIENVDTRFIKGWFSGNLYRDFFKCDDIISDIMIKKYNINIETDTNLAISLIRSIGGIPKYYHIF
jgi:hypothetical protein